MDSLIALRIFVRVAESGSFSRAAEDLALPRATVSAAVQTVEARAGSRLLHRTTRKVALSADGALFLERARQLLDQADDLDTLFRQGADHVTGLLRVSLPERLATRTLLPAVPALLDRHPGLRLEWSVTDRFVDLIGAGYDCVIRGGALKESRLLARRLGEMTLGTFASPAYLSRHGIPPHPDGLAGHRLVGYASPSEGLDFAWRGPHGAVELPGPLAVDNSEAQVAAALAGLGLIQVPAYGLRPHLAAGTLVEVLAAFRPPPLPLHVLYPHRRHRSPKLIAFIDWAMAAMAEAGAFAPS